MPPKPVDPTDNGNGGLGAGMIILIIIIILVLCGLGYFGYRKYQEKKLVSRLVDLDQNNMYGSQQPLTNGQ